MLPLFRTSSIHVGAIVARVVVIGAGVGGLCGATRLALSGHDVTLVEKEAQPGGKLRQLAVGAFKIDSGPTVLTMRSVFEELFAAAGERIEDHLTLTPLAILARHAWDASGHLDLFADRTRSADAIGGFSGASDAHGYLRFCVDAAAIHRTLRDTFLRAEKPTAFTLAQRVRSLSALLAIRPFETLWNRLHHYFGDRRLIQLFARYATYNGASPFLAPATLMLIAHVEQDGVWSVEGGMFDLAKSLAALAVRCGVKLRCGAPADLIEIRGRGVCGVVLASGEHIDADAVLFNGDASALGHGLLGNAARAATESVPSRARSLSAITISLAGRVEGFPLARHNVFFGNDYRSEFDDLFKSRRLPRDPTVYVCAQSNRDHATMGDAEPIFMLANAPADGERSYDKEETGACRQRMRQRLEQCGLRLTILEERLTNPTDFHRLFPATGGALYGRSPHGPFGAFARPGSRSRIRGLYLTGGSVHPGAGLPMAALSGQLAAQAIDTDLPSI
jgi:1-hydroxycarotenoid 3,4-desaturase